MSRACPECNAPVRTDTPRCPKCFVKIRPAAPVKRRAAEEDEDDRPRRTRRDPDEQIAEKPRKRRPEPVEEDEEPRGKRSAGGSNTLLWVLGGVAACVLILVVGGGGLALALLAVRTAPVVQGPAPDVVIVNNGRKPDLKLVAGNAQPQPRALEATWVDGTQSESLPINGSERPWLVLDAAGHTATVSRVLFTPDGNRLLTLSHDKTARLWDVRTGEPLRTLRLPIGPGSEGALFAAAISPDGARLALSGDPVGRGQQGIFVHVIDLEKGRVERVLKGHHGNVVTALDFSRDAKFLASGSHDRTVRIYEVETGAVKNVLQGHTDRVGAVRFSHDGKRLATGSMDKTVRVFTLPDGKTEHVLDAISEAGIRGVRGVAWSRDGILASAGDDGFIRLWGPDGKKLKEMNVSEGEQSTVRCSALDMTDDGAEVLYGGVTDVGKVGIYDTKTGTRRLRFTKHNNTVQGVRLSADGKLAASTGGNDHDVYVWNTADGSVVQHLKAVGRAGWGVGWSMDGKHVAFGGVNLGEQDKRKLEGTFRLDALGVGNEPSGEYVRAVTTVRTARDRVVTLKQKDFFTIEVFVNGKLHGAFRSPSKDERLYSFTLIPGERAIIGGSYAAYLLEMNLGTPGKARIARTFTGHSGLYLSLATSPDGKYFVSGSTDQTMCFWSPEQDRPLMSVFVAEREWIAWTPEGYYACSAAGERLMGWQINQGQEQFAAFHPAARFRRSLYRPAAIRQVLPSGGIQAALKKLGQDQTTNVTQVLPPEVEITSPKTRVRQAGGKVTVEAEAKSVGGNAIQSLRLLVNGRPHDGEGGLRKVAAPKPGRVKASWEVDLPPGKHSLAVLAESAVSKGVSPPVLAENTTEDRTVPALYVLAIGVSDYPGDMKLKYAASDAQFIVRSLERNHNGAFREVKSRIITDRQATKQGVTEALGWLKERMTPSDVAIVFLSGHGTRDDDGNFYFVPIDVNPRDLANSCIPGEELKKALGNLPGRVIAMFDACHSGAAAEKKTVGQTDDLARDLVTEDYGIVCLCSSMGNEYSMESDATKAGFFTWALAEGLTGKADLNGDRVVFLHELALYARARVRQISWQQAGRFQNPTVGWPDTFRTFPMAKSP